MLRLIALALLFGPTVSCQNSNKKTAEDQHQRESPNFLIIIADDAGWNDFSFHCSEIQTPTLDSLANNGLILNRFYTYPTCSPARASFLTGRPASRMGILAPISDKSELKLPDSIVTLPQALKKLNYQTALIGKWHLGLKPENGPEAYGFDYSYGFLHCQLDQYAHTYKNGDSTWHRNGQFIDEKGHVTDLLTQEAVDYLAKREFKNSPFYVQIAYSAPHIPLQEPETWLSRYDTIKDSSRKAYAAAMSHMDAGIHKILQALKAKQLSNNTIILFFSDNGAQEEWIPTSQYSGKFDPNYSLGSNKPLRDFKTTNYEGAIRVPAFISYPKQIESGATNNVTTVIDWMPTFLNWANAATIPPSVEGENITYLLNPKKINRVEPVYIRGHLQESVIVYPFKLIRSRYKNSNPEYELFNIETDPTEVNNLVQEEKEKFQELLQILKMEFAKDSPAINKELPK
ncbi:MULTISPECIES: sulfatase-like hydrolase/transferase [unclassified Leeuwenhoekiella]|uniref:sulfatase-like hydrolase/transferase n=1 Tax=unclassified Leeuwenhoekiella TaxID=2615029 RepID=UPI000C4946C9|nr:MULTISPECIES: sulfatase-like hydrolase/transferase [unclassified Leeuwenhoekiella]MAW93649.1 arylsulfatase [Leeuwenhoekiella sp.]MBA80392.1 arylsulfatase [Leeuwenhoekiella sp.]|tara:strand:- start:25160 stop:26533 length:1374 start_codon:yes stop_codon:yes gene_type:complete